MRSLHPLKELSRQSGLPLVAAGDVHMHVRSRRRLQDVLTAMRLGKPVAAVRPRAVSERASATCACACASRSSIRRELLAETLAIAERCRFSLDELRYEYPDELVPRRRDAGDASCAS